VRPAILALGIVQALCHLGQHRRRLKVNNDPLAALPASLGCPVLLQGFGAGIKKFRAECQLLNAVEAKIAELLPQSAVGHHVPLLAQVQADRFDGALGGLASAGGAVVQVHHLLRSHSRYEQLVGIEVAGLTPGA